MTRTSLRGLLPWWMTGTALALVVATASAWWDVPLPVTTGTVAVLVVMAVAVLVAGLPVRRYTRQVRRKLSGVEPSGSRPKRGGKTARVQTLDPLRAARVLVLARAASRGGATLTGWYLGFVLGMLNDFDQAAVPFRCLVSGLCAVGAVLVLVAGLIVERWCQLPGDGENSGGSAPADPEACAG